jgi:Flp pilus assembly pilin Flp
LPTVRGDDDRDDRSGFSEEEREMRDAFARLFVLAQTTIAGLREREEGQTLVEYALILALVSIGTLAALLALTNKLNTTLYQDIINGV